MRCKQPYLAFNIIESEKGQLKVAFLLTVLWAWQM